MRNNIVTNISVYFVQYKFGLRWRVGWRTTTALERIQLLCGKCYYYWPVSWSGVATPHCRWLFAAVCSARCASTSLLPPCMPYFRAAIVFIKGVARFFLPVCILLFFFICWLSNRSSDLFMQTRAIGVVVAVVIVVVAAVIAALKAEFRK